MFIEGCVQVVYCQHICHWGENLEKTLFFCLLQECDLMYGSKVSIAGEEKLHA